MGSFADFWENEVLDHLFMKGSYTMPTNLWVGLSTADPTDDASGLAEPDGTGSYARIETAGADWDAAAAGATANATILAFAESTAAWSTGATPLTHFGVFDALSGGNMVAYGSLSISRKVEAAGVVLRFPIGELDVTLD